MKKMIKHSLVLVFASVIGFTQSGKTQGATKEIAGFIKKFQEAYNAKNSAVLKTMYTTDAVSTNSDGNVDNGSDAIIARLKSVFDENKVTIAIKQDKVETSAEGSTVGKGAYHITGKGKSGDDINVNGKYTITMLKEKGVWKIAKSILSEN